MVISVLYLLISLISLIHSTKVTLMLNVETGSISTQHHVLFYDSFETVHSTFADLHLTLDTAFSGPGMTCFTVSGLKRYLPSDDPPSPPIQCIM